MSVDGGNGGELPILQDFLVENEDLEHLEALLDRFNIFEAIGAVRQELRHSDFLAFLLDPQQSHGLSDLFATRLLQRALRTTTADVRPIDLELWSLGGLEVRREWRNIDVLLLDATNRLAVIIENKIDSVEHSAQLARYWDTIAAEHPDYRMVGLFLTPDGTFPSDTRYAPIGYEVVCSLVEEVVQRRGSSVGAEVAGLLRHYAQMLRRHIVSDAEIASLCRKIYTKHRRALDLIFEYRPDRQAEIRELLEKLIGETPGLVIDSCSKGYVHFLPEAWDSPELLVGSGWTKTGRMLLFEFMNSANSLRLYLYIGPGPDVIRAKLFELALTKQPPFKPPSKTLQKKWNAVYVRPFLVASAYADEDIDQMGAEISKQWQRFVSQDLPALSAAIADEFKGEFGCGAQSPTNGTNQGTEPATDVPSAIQTGQGEASGDLLSGREIA